MRISLTTWRDRVIVQLDQGEAGGESRPSSMPSDGRTGRVVWQQSRKVGASWASPLSFEFNGKGQIVCLSIPWAIGYNADTGAELWRADCLNGEVTPTPVYSAGLSPRGQPFGQACGVSARTARVTSPSPTSSGPARTMCPMSPARPRPPTWCSH